MYSKQLSFHIVTTLWGQLFYTLSTSIDSHLTTGDCSVTKLNRSTMLLWYFGGSLKMLRHIVHRGRQLSPELIGRTSNFLFLQIRSRAHRASWNVFTSLSSCIQALYHQVT